MTTPPSELRWNGRPDDFHHHLRDGDALKLTVPHVAQQFARCIVMPNLVPPVTTTGQALAYRERIMSHVPAEFASRFTPLMTLYMTDHTSPEEIKTAAASGKVFAVKLYPAGATTNSDSGVTNIEKVYPALQAMSEVGMPLLMHGEVTDQCVDVFDREAVFIERVLKPLVSKFPQLKIVMEHITTEEAAKFVAQAPANVAATITPQHLLYNRNAIFQGGLRPHKYCLPVLKREKHRQALVKAIGSGSTKFFLGTDSAPHLQSKKESSCGCAGIYSAHAAVELYAEAFASIGKIELLEAFACRNGADFYGIPRNDGETVLKHETWEVPASYPFESGSLVPLRAEEKIDWKLESQ
ncbi:hypothetical protein Poli38472_012786 [Pythium oligandrum]|uniref:Dihydroorotase, mitochondrial n=1 Tax=Pythium oligandrum TaxID=41045 RepID=A0A8K1CF02_PYTOL|nr:hypothetical protein Poli38472_012786 [Pythium oligandrum]|eukprot:TMW61595.1 hypothetical protein Poli38472_012786 [Pythium oligandrum]